MFAQVAVDIAHSKIDRLFTYIVPDTMQLELGNHVLVPFGRGNKLAEGFVLMLSTAPAEPDIKLKSVFKLLEPYPIFTKEQLSLAYWMRETYRCLLVDALRLMIPTQLRGGHIKEKKQYVVRLAEDADFAAIRASMMNKDGSLKAPRQVEILEMLHKTGAPIAYNEVLKFLPGSSNSLNALITKGFIIREEFTIFRTPAGVLKQEDTTVDLTASQENTIRAISFGMKTKRGTFLIHGVTGSGKTEVYMQCINSCIENGQHAILLVPEISLTPQTMGLFRARFGNKVALLHSRLSAGERFDEWRKIRLGLVQVAVGARSVVFAPFDKLGLIVVDEEHEQSYQSETSPRYHAIEVARKRCLINNATLILGSATPSITSYYRAKTGRYTLLELPERVNLRPMPKFKIVDMREEYLCGNTGIFSNMLLDELDACLKAGKQAILFLNRRGYSTFISCRSCGYVFQCKNCDISMTYHRTENRVKCHYCGLTETVPELCPNCGRKFIKYSGIGTQQVHEQMNYRFPKAAALRMDYDSTRSKDAHEKILSAFARKEAQVLIGTQMVAKGLDFPDVTLVGVIDADKSMYLPDYRSAERTFQLLTQVAGRAGRDEIPGVVVVQTNSPLHPSIRFARTHDYKGFFTYELAQRRAALFPPFSLFIRVLLTGKDESQLYLEALHIGRELEKAALIALGSGNSKDLIYLCASPSPIKKRQGDYRYQVLIKLLRTERTAQVLNAIYNCINENSKERFFTVEINPNDLF